MNRNLLSKRSYQKKLLPLNSSSDQAAIKGALERQGKIYIDGAEQPVRRPKNSVEQKDNYSGKKKKHTSKILVVSDETRSITAITPVYVGKTHDFSIFKEENLVEALPAKIPVYTDTGFEGIEKLCNDIIVRKPKKKRRKRKLNGGEKLGNRIISRERVKVEHAIGGVKRFEIVSSIFRGITHSMNTTMEVACGLWNYHISKTSGKPLPQWI